MRWQTLQSKCHRVVVELSEKPAIRVSGCNIGLHGRPGNIWPSERSLEVLFIERDIRSRGNGCSNPVEAEHARSGPDPDGQHRALAEPTTRYPSCYGLVESIHLCQSTGRIVYQDDPGVFLQFCYSE